MTTTESMPILSGIAEPTLEDVSIYDMNIDASTQRSWDEKWSEKIAKEFNEDMLGVFRLSQRSNGTLYILDGQHRWHACKSRKWTQEESYVKALVYTGLTLQQEAALYVAFNVKTRKPNAVDTFRLEVNAGDVEATHIQAVLDNHGLVVSFGGGSRAVSAVTALREIYRKGGIKLLDRTFDVTLNAWGTDRDARDGSLLKGIAHVLHKCKTIDVDSLEDKLGKSGRPGQLLGRARTFREASRRTLWLEVAHQVTSIYNTSRRTKKIAL